MVFFLSSLLSLSFFSSSFFPLSPFSQHFIYISSSLITEFFPFGDLSKILVNFDDYPELSSCLLTKFSWDGAEAINCLHRNGIIHNDIKGFYLS